MVAHRFESAASRPAPHHLALLAREPESPWEARAFADLVPPATLAEARAGRDDLARLLRREREAAADFLLALADFDRRRGWERLGHASLFSFLKRELGLSNGAASLRCSAARLLPRFRSVEAALRSGGLCLSAVGQLARVLTPENEAEVLPRFLGCSAQEAREVAAAILPRPDLPRREVVTAVPAAARAARPEGQPVLLALAAPDLAAPTATAPTATGLRSPTNLPSPSVRSDELAATHPAWEGDEIEPLGADLRRLHLTVSARFQEKVAAARDGLSHATPRATREQVLERALDLLLEQQARRKALVKRPRRERPRLAVSSPPPHPAQASVTAPTGAAPADPRRVPAAVEREVRLRDGDRCRFPLDAGGVCGSSRQVQLDHVVPLALGGQTTVDNLRCARAVHNRLAARLALGPAVASLRRPGRPSAP